MKKYFLILLTVITSIISSCSENEISVDVEVIVNKLPQGSIVYITGNDEQLGNWQPDIVSLDEVEKGKWVKSFSFPKGKKLEFKFSRGSWNKEALNDDGTVPPNYALMFEMTPQFQLKLIFGQIRLKER